MCVSGRFCFTLLPNKAPIIVCSESKNMDTYLKRINAKSVNEVTKYTSHTE